MIVFQISCNDSFKMYSFLKVILGTSYACKYKTTQSGCTLEWDSGAANDFSEALDELRCSLSQILLLDWDKILYYLGDSFAKCRLYLLKYYSLLHIVLIIGYLKISDI